MTRLKAWSWGLLTLISAVLLTACSAWIASEAYVPGGWSHMLVLQWAAVLVSLVIMATVAGYLANGRWIGVLIDERNRISLARLQWLLWFLLLFSAYFTGAVWDTAFGDLPVIEANLFAVIGITTGSAVIANVVVQNKKVDASPTPNAVPPAPTPGVPLTAASATDPTAQRIGKADVNNSPADASFEDLYLGEDATNRQSVDASRLQKLVITFLLVIAYAEMVWAAFVDASATYHAFSMPIVGTNFLGMLGVSHAAYLVAKASPKQ